ncbi:thiamine pyrophosphate-dependent enzyme [Microcoleus sp. D3_18_C4]|uniref:thiamine pyrophosphate-dependent enzyme n=1 Tax=Microcoleus sp. D3_18_C4 TaxID=3055335 RepID=UPI002FD63C90
MIPNGPFIQVDLNQNAIARSFPIELGIVSEVGRAIDYLCELGQQVKADEKGIDFRRRLIDEIKSTKSPFRNPEKRDSEASPIFPQALMKCINEMMPEDGHLFIDCANCVGWSVHYIVANPPLQMHNSLAMGSMGFGTAAVIGGKMGAPYKTCVAIVGDGAFMMHGNEISTAAQYGVGAIWVVMDNNELGMISQYMNQFCPQPGKPGFWKDYYKNGNPNLAQFAAALGADAFDI